MQPFGYRRAESVEEAATAAADGQSLIAGGTELVNWMRLGIHTPANIMDLSGLNALRGIVRENDSIVIGALTTLAEIERSSLIRASAPALSQACLLSASAQIRNCATLGGNILQKTRCPYFRANAAPTRGLPWPCSKRVPGSGCAARDGHYDQAVLFGGSDDCVASQPSDPAVALAALDASVEVVGPDGARSIAMDEFHLTQAEGTQDSSPVETRLEPSEIIVGFRLPLTPLARSSTYVKVRQRASFEYALVSAAVCLDRAGDGVAGARIALGSVAQKPWRLRLAEAALKGRQGDQILDRAIFVGDFAAARPLKGQRYKITLAQNAVLRGIETLMEAPGE